MDNEQLVKDLTAKDEQKAIDAARAMVDGANDAAFKILADKSEFLFDFVRSNVNKRLQKVICRGNLKNLYGFLKVYSADFEETIIGAFAKFADEDLTDEMLNLLENGTDSEKAYSAKYFSYIPDTIAADKLTQYAFEDNEAIAFNSARALGSMKITAAYEKAIGLLASDDEFTVLKAVKFLVAYEDKNAVDLILKAMEKSSMCENISGEIPYLESLLDILKRDKAGAMLCIDNILSGLGEILSLGQIFCFEVYDVLSYLISYNSQDKNSQASCVLLKALSKFEMLNENDEYTFDEDKKTKQEITEIFNLLKSQKQEFWQEQKRLIIQELEKSEFRVISALRVISEFNIIEAEEKIKALLNSDNEILLCEAVTALKQLKMLENINKDDVLNKVSDDNKKALIQSLF